MSLDPAGIQEECKQIFTYLTTAGSSTDRGASFMSGLVGDLSASRGEGLAARKLIPSSGNICSYLVSMMEREDVPMAGPLGDGADRCAVSADIASGARHRKRPRWRAGDRNSCDGLRPHLCGCGAGLGPAVSGSGPGECVAGVRAYLPDQHEHTRSVLAGGANIHTMPSDLHRKLVEANSTATPLQERAS